ncbi:helicase swr1 [Lojkania enalia]|uniref:DNA helicase n=1 Tax=Lojkania enalia TaxID=147567 RepID=A0A9P4MYR7_9PLEO|nr:helicase swr1 [Didymosphaeria enalia]
MEVAEVEPENRDDIPSPPTNTPGPNDGSQSAHDDDASDDAGAVSIKLEDEPPTVVGDDGGVAHRPSKRRKVDEFTPRRSTSRVQSPPWRSFAAEGPTTIITDGIRKSARVNKETPTPVPAPEKRSTRNAAKAVQINGNAKHNARQHATRSVSGPATASKSKAAPAVRKKASAPVLKSPGPRKSERQRNASNAAAAAAATAAISSSPVVRNGSPESTKKRPGRPRKTTLTSDDVDCGLYSTPLSEYKYAYEQYNNLQSSPEDVDPNGPAPRLRLRLKKPPPPNRHPQHAPPVPKFPTFADWLATDDPLEGEESQKITREKAEEEAERRLRIVEAVENGVLSQARCSIFHPEPAEEPPPQYRHWDHVVAHAIHFNKLLREENTYHRRMAKILAKEAVDYWKEKYKRKTQEEIDQEESERAMLRYKQLVKDVKDSWALVKVEIDKERVARWEEEQLQLGHKAMDDMFNQAQEILGRGMVDSASSFISDDRESEDEGDFETGMTNSANDGNDDDHDENMSSDSDSDDGHGLDEDANLTAEQLREKYGQLPDLPSDSSENEDEEGDDEDAEKGSDNEHTPETTSGMELDMEGIDNLPANPFAHTNGFYDDDTQEENEGNGVIDPSKVELEQVDEALLDSEDVDGETSESGSQAWSSDEASGESEQEGDSESDEEDGEEEDLGVMGFLAPSEIKKMKEAAKAVMQDNDKAAGEDTPKANGINGHQDQADAEVDKEILVANGEVEAEPKIEVHHVGDKHDAVPEPTIEVLDSESVEKSATEKLIARSRSRHTSSPPRTEIPSLLRGTLREYQHDGLDWLVNLYDSETNGILADEMGLGKTIQTISLLAYIAVHRGVWGPHLVVVPTSVMLNWEMEFKKWCPGFRVLTYYGDINERKRKRTGWRTTRKDMINVVITSYQLILQDAAAFKMRPWEYLILDEAHNIKNFKSQRWQTMLNLRTERRLLLTGTPLQNNIDELWSLLYFLMPAGFAGEGRIAGLEEFTMALKNPTSQILEQGRQQLDAEAQKIVKKLHEVLRPYLLRRLKADVEKQMPAKYEHVVYCKLSKRQRQLYDGFMGRASTKEILASGNYMTIINCLMSLRKVCNHPDLFETRAIVTSMAMPKSVAAEFEIKDFLIRKRLHEDVEERKVNLDALNLVFARREQTSMLHARRAQQIRATRPLEDLVERQTRRLNPPPQMEPSSSIKAVLSAMAYRQNVAVRDHLQKCLNLTRSRTQFLPIYGKGLVNRLTIDYNDYAFGAQEDREKKPMPHTPQIYRIPDPMRMSELPKTLEPEREPGKKGKLGFRNPFSPRLASQWYQRQISLFPILVPTLEQRADILDPIVTRFSCVTPAVAADDVAQLALSKRGVELVRSSQMANTRDPFHEPRIRQSIAFPDKRLLQYDCGKLQRLAILLRDLQAGGHRALIFTQMTKVLDILEQFLNIHGHRYLRLDGATKVEHRQILTDRFNKDPRILCFILSSRSGGLGINLTGADTVIFYDLDWNPAMDKQCQDRSHRIGQTRDVHIYKFVSEYTIEANILRKSNQKRLLDDVIIQRGDFTTDYFNKVTWRDALEDEPVDEAGAAMDRVLGEKAGLLGDAKVMRAVEDTEDQNAATIAQKEIVDEIHDDQVDFNESSTNTPANAATRAASEEADQAKADNVEMQHIDEYMLKRFRDEYGQEPYKPPTDRQKRYAKGKEKHRAQKKRRF